MRVNGLFLTIIGIFFGIIAVVYWFTAYEDAGFLMLIGSCFLGLLPGGYYLWWSGACGRSRATSPTPHGRRRRGHRRRSPGRASGRSCSAWPPCSPR